MLGAAALGAFGYWLAIFPVDVIKSSMQTDSIIKGQRKYTDMVTAAKVRGAVWMARCRIAGGDTSAGLC